MAFWMTVGAMTLLAAVGTVMVRLRDTRLATCPRSGKRVVLRVVSDDHTGRWQDIESCSALPRPFDVACGKTCMKSC